MSYRVVFTAEAERTFDQNYYYLEQEWGKKVLQQFINDVETAILQLGDNPLLCSLHDRRANIRKSVINKRIVLFFRINDHNTIELLTFWNTHRNPIDLKF